MDYAKAVKQLREKMLLTQQELAKELGVSFASINRWETGLYDPTMKMKRVLAPYFKKYGVKLEEKENVK